MFLVLAKYNADGIKGLLDKGGSRRRTFALPDLRSAAPNGMTYSICWTGIFPTSF